MAAAGVVALGTAAGRPEDLADLLAAAARVPAFTAVVDPDDARFLPPGDMPARIAEACRETGQTVPSSRAETVRCILDSLAPAYRRTLRRAAELSGRDVEVVHLVGGGARTELPCQLTADACGLPVVAGPVQAGALGNALVQVRAAGVLTGGLAELRALLRATQEARTYLPSSGAAAAAPSKRPGDHTTPVPSDGVQIVASPGRPVADR
ncbi:FGGY-family carbohydrate kinase [Blastococcus sp. SYSU DS1024]